MKSNAEPIAGYDFEPRYIELEAARIHYVDEGAGPPVLFVHGTPTWSYLYRHLIRALAGRYRVVAPDLLGYGRSEKPSGADYRPEAHARRLTRLIDRLGLEAIVLGVHDVGGPIGLSYALAQPDNVRGLVLFNTWMWSLVGTPAGKFSRLMSGSLGRYLYTRVNFSPRVLLRSAYGDRSKLTRDIHRNYLDPFPTPEERVAPWVMARELIGSTEWYEGLWRQRARLEHNPALVLWGMKDRAFGPDALERWRQAMPRARVVEFTDAGHFVQEEAPERVASELNAFLSELHAH